MPVIVGLARRLGTVPFPPHVTLLPGLDLAEEQAESTTGCLAASISPFPVTPCGVQGQEQHFRCLFVLLGPDPPLLGLGPAPASR